MTNYYVGLNPLNGTPQYIKAATGDPNDEENPGVPERRDPAVAAAIGDLKTAVVALPKVISFHTYNFQGTAASGVVKTVAGSLCSFYARNRNANNTYYLMFFNRVDAPTQGIANFVMTSFVLYPSSQLGLGTEFFGTEGALFGNGIAYGISPSEDQYSTAINPVDIRMTIGFR